MPRLYLIDDEVRTLKSLERLLRIAGFEVQSHSSAAEFLRTLGPEMEGVIITDLSMPEMTGHDLLERLTSMGCRLPVIFLTGRAEISDSVRALKRGAVNFLTKPANLQELRAAIQEALEFRRVTAESEAQDSEACRRFSLLTPREREVCLKITQGLLNKQAAGDLGISEKTVKIHRARVMEKMQAGSMPELVRLMARVQRVQEKSGTSGSLRSAASLGSA